MTIQTRPCFYYGLEVTELNYAIDMDEGGPELQASLRQGFYTLEGLAVELQRALNAAGGTYNYFASVDRQNRLISITEENSNTFALNFASGSRNGITAAGLISFAAADQTGASAYTGTIPTGKTFEPQYLLQQYVGENDYQEAISATRNESSSGVVEICRFGTRKFVEFNITYQNNSASKNLGPIEYNPTGKDDLVDFMQWVTVLGGIEMMDDRTDKTTFKSLLLEKTPISGTGTGYKLRELYGRGLPGFFETGLLRFRLLEDANC